MVTGTLQYGATLASDARLTASSPMSEFGGYLVPVSDDENVSTISFIRTSKTRIFCLQCPEKRRKQAYIYAKIRTGSDEFNAKFCPNCLPECLINHQVNISDLTI